MGAHKQYCGAHYLSINTLECHNCLGVVGIPSVIPLKEQNFRLSVGMNESSVSKFIIMVRVTFFYSFSKNVAK